MTIAQIVTSHIGTGFLIAIVYVSWLLQGMSQRMGEVTRMPPYYKGFNIGNIFLILATFGYIFICSAALVNDPQIFHTTQALLLLFYGPLLLGLGINVSIAIVYWGWLIRER